ncbi:lytic transglycosylase domain-containing protein [Massilia glaciei]|uniref:Lytic transglycosylase domain-containing protein n=2 Tax=Massilia glaciei TaxID=1524097 RepID=A0A2U2HC36_9BURK|nr:lytic transglycosylase domain-containing protein [Massilia glaciei]
MKTKITFRPGRIGRLAIVTLCTAYGVGSLGVAPPACADNIYMRTDPEGVQYFTNVPSDSGYQLALTASESRTAPPIVSSARRDRDRGRERHALVVSHAAADTGLPESLLHAVIKAESNYNANAVSPRGAVGLMQLMPETARRYGALDARDPAANVLAGARYLKKLLTLFDADLTLALAAYNAGPAAVVRSRRAVPPYAETRRYVPRVLELYRRDGAP